MRFFVMERAKVGTVLDPKEFAKIGAEDLKYKRRLEKEGKIVGGPCLDILADGYILETKTIEEMGEIFFNSPPTSSWGERCIRSEASKTAWKE